MARPTPCPDFCYRWIQPYPDGLYVPTPNGEGIPVIVIGVEDDEGDLFDSVAWHPKRPGRWWTRYGDAALLGMAEVARCTYYGEPLTLFETPADWVKARGAGAVILDWQSDLYDLLASPPSIVCRTQALSHRLHEALARPRLSITVGAPHAA